MISDLWVDPGFHGKGVGKKLLDATIKHAVMAGLDLISLEVLSANRRAAAFYERNSFNVVWRGKRFDDALGVEIDKTRMERAL